MQWTKTSTRGHSGVTQRFVSGDFVVWKGRGYSNFWSADYHNSPGAIPVGIPLGREGQKNLRVAKRVVSEWAVANGVA